MTSFRGDQRLWLTVIAIGVVIGLARSFWIIVILDAAPATAGRALMVVNNVALWTSGAALCVGVIALGRAWPLTRPRLWRAVAIHAIASIAFPFVHLKLWALCLMVWEGWTGGQAFTLGAWIDERWSIDFLSARFQLEWEFTVYWGTVGLAHALSFRDRSRQQAVAAAELDAALTRAQLEGLQRQMQPHFLFNSLQSITALMHRDVPAAERMMEQLGLVLRGLLKTSPTALIPLRQELEYVDHYLAVEQVNLGDRLTVVKTIARDALEAQVPALLVQPLVENAIRHAIARHVGGGQLHLSVHRDDQRLYLSVSDSGPGGPAQEGSGVALDNIRRRLELMYPGTHEFKAERRTDEPGTIVHVVLPLTHAVSC